MEGETAAAGRFAFGIILTRYPSIENIIYASSSYTN
jgi:hypothetical protein